MELIRTAYVADGEKDYVLREQYVGGIRDWCLEANHAGMHGTSDMKLAASIPTVVIEHYLNMNGITFAEFTRNPEHQRRVLNSPELSDFRIWPGKV